MFGVVMTISHTIFLVLKIQEYLLICSCFAGFNKQSEDLENMSNYDEINLTRQILKYFTMKVMMKNQKRGMEHK